MTKFCITCSYYEVLRFKKSAAVAAVSNSTLQGISINNGLIQMVVDNFDADISSQNGKISTHSLAMLIMQPSKDMSLTHSHTMTPFDTPGKQAF